MSASHSGYRFPGAGGGTAFLAPASSASNAPRVICPGAGTPFPPLDSRLVTPETREEMIDGVLMETMASDPDHGDPHFDYSAVLSVLLQRGYIGSIDMLTRYSESDDFAADLTIRRGGTDPQTGQRYLEELALEIGNSQRRAHIARKAARMTRRGVRRILAVMIREQQAYEWDDAQGTLLRLGGDTITDPQTLLGPLPVALVLLIARGAADLVPPEQVQAAVKDFQAEALAAQGNPVIQRIRADSELRGELRSRVEDLLAILETRSVPVDDVSRRRIQNCTDPATLRRWLIRAATASGIDEVLT